jgi:hypothetical protein
MRIASNGQGVMIRYMTSMLQVKSVLHSDGFEGMGSIVEVVVVYTEKDVQHDIRKDFDFSILRVMARLI